MSKQRSCVPISYQLWRRKVRKGGGLWKPGSQGLRWRGLGEADSRSGVRLEGEFGPIEAERGLWEVK